MDISIIIVNYNGEKIIKECLDSILSYQSNYSMEIIVIDNASKDQSSAILSKYSNRIQIVQNPDNKGFATANNQGLKIATGKFIFLFNNDAILLPKTLDTLINYLNNHPEVGAVAPQLLNPDRSNQQYGSSLGQWMYSKTDTRYVSFISGAAILMQKSVLEKLGGLDENFFFYNEDIDLCKQLMKKGYKIAFMPTAQVIHYGGVSTQTRKASSVIEGVRGGLYLWYKHYPRIAFQIYRWTLCLGTAIGLCVIYPISLFKPTLNEKVTIFKKLFIITIKNNIFKEI